MALPQIMDGVRKAQLQLKSDGHNVEAEAVHRLLVSRASSTRLNKVLHADLARVRSLLLRAHDAMIAEDGIFKVEWDQLLADMAKELGVG